MKTVCIQIGNSDNKLSQQKWSSFCAELKNAVDEYAGDIHFLGGSSCEAPWQNYCFIAAVQPHLVDQLKDEITKVRKYYDQDSVAFLEGSVDYL